MSIASFAKTKKPVAVQKDCFVQVLMSFNPAECRTVTLMPISISDPVLERRLQKIEQDILMLKYPPVTSGTFTTPAGTTKDIADPFPKLVGVYSTREEADSVAKKDSKK